MAVSPIGPEQEGGERPVALYGQVLDHDDPSLLGLRWLERARSLTGTTLTWAPGGAGGGAGAGEGGGEGGGDEGSESES